MFARALMILLLVILFPGRSFGQTSVLEESLEAVTSRTLLPGNSIDLTLRVRNIGTNTGPASLNLQNRRFNETLAGLYTFTAMSGGCANGATFVGGSTSTIQLPFGNLAPNETRTCVFRVRREPATTSDLALWVCGGLPDLNTTCSGTRQLNIGALPDLTLRVDPPIREFAGSDRLLVRMHVDNPGDQAVASRAVTTPCREFDGGLFDGTPYTIDTAVTDGCGDGDSEICLNFTGVNAFSLGFDAGMVPARGSASCVIRLTPATGTGPLPRGGGFPMEMRFLEDAVGLVNGGVAVDPNAANDVDGFGFGEPQGVPVGRGVIVVLGLLVVLFGAAWLSRRGIVH